MGLFAPGESSEGLLAGNTGEFTSLNFLLFVGGDTDPRVLLFESPGELVGVSGDMIIENLGSSGWFESIL